MPYSVEVVQRARERLAQARADRESENRDHLARAYAQVPRLREIDRLLRLTMAQAAQAVFAQGGDVEEAMNRAREDNKALQREREALIAAHFEEGYLDDSPVCDRCGGELVIRKDDQPETVRDRLATYHEQTEPLVEFYRQRGKLVDITDQGSIEATNAYILKMLEA